MMTDDNLHMQTLPSNELSFLKKLIPHREPMIMIDTLHDHGATQVTSKLTITKNNLLTKGGLFLEVGLIENMAQTVALHTGYAGYLVGETVREGYIAAIKKLKIYRLPKIGETIMTQVKITYAAMDMTLIEVTTLLDGDLIADATMSTMLKPQ